MRRRTKIVATVGPLRKEKEDNRTDELGKFVDGVIPHDQLLDKFIEAGVDIIRLNMSFASRQDQYGDNEKRYLAWLNEHKDTKADRIAVLGDLPGPKIRLGDVFLGGRNKMKKGDTLFLGFGKERPSEPGAMVLVNEKPFNEAISKVNGERDFSAYVKALGKPVFLSIGDGKVELQTVEARSSGIVECKITSDLVTANDMPTRKGLTIKHATLQVGAFQEADKKALDFLLRNGGELLAYVAVSFAQSQWDILAVKDYIENHEVIQRYLQEQRKINELATTGVISPGVIAKIETRRALKNIHEILDVADGLMVARGDLGEQIPAEEVPEIQKDLIRLCNARGKVVITATQMLDSMETKPVPTRAEATDVFNAILDGTDAVMLSGETATGSHPIRAIQTMNRIAERAEQYYFLPGHRRPFEQVVSDSARLVEAVTKRLDGEENKAREISRHCPEEARPYFCWLADLYGEKATRSRKQHITDRICEAACRLSEATRHLREEKPCDSGQSAEQMPKPIVVPTTVGRTAFMISRFRPQGCIIGAAHFERTYRKLLLNFGVQPLRIGARHTTSRQVIRDSLRKAIEEQLLRMGEEIVTTSGTRLYIPGTTNMIQLLLATNLEDD